jgi:predicted transcriptional regulator
MALERQGDAAKSMTLRLDRELADRVEALASVEDRTVSDVVREALAEHVERRRSDPQFREMLEANLAKHERLLRMLAEG